MKTGSKWAIGLMWVSAVVSATGIALQVYCHRPSYVAAVWPLIAALIFHRDTVLIYKLLNDLRVLGKHLQNVSFGKFAHSLAPKTPSTLESTTSPGSASDVPGNSDTNNSI